ncbi:hypothetical protein J6590_077896, partial [Homalodisca vitripennis]
MPARSRNLTQATSPLFLSAPADADCGTQERISYRGKARLKDWRARCGGALALDT